MSDIVPVRNLYYLFAYAWDQFELASRTDVGEETGPDGVELLARVLIGGTNRLLLRGLDRTYIPQREETPRLKGRIILAETLRRSLLNHGRAACEYDELEHDSLPNRLVKATFRQLSRSGSLPPDLKSSARKLLSTFDTAGIKDIRPTRALFRQVQLHRNNSFYSFLLNICELLNEGRFPDQEGNTGVFAAVLRDERRMGKLFERFLLNFYRAELREFRISPETVPWDISNADPIALAFLPTMRTDIVLRSTEQTIVIDAKFYRETLQKFMGKETVRSNHLYQLFAYLKNMEAKGGADARASGVLIYPTVQADMSLSYTISGHKIRIETVNLAARWSAIHSRLLDIICGQAAQGVQRVELMSPNFV